MDSSFSKTGNVLILFFYSAIVRLLLAVVIVLVMHVKLQIQI